MAFQGFRVPGYARDVYLNGTNRLNARDGYLGVAKTPDDYYTPTEQYANDNFDMITMNDALAKGWINQVEYDETLALGTMPAVKYPPGSSPVAPTE